MSNIVNLRPDRNPVELEFIDRLVGRYKGTGPRYTSYPTVIEFSEHFAEEDLLGYLEISNQKQIPADLSLYLHLPFCSHLCFYCGCNKVVTKNQSKARTYLDYLFREIAYYGDLVDSKRAVRQLHFGGGTPTFYDVEQIAAILEGLDEQFYMVSDPSRDYSIEIDPRTVDHNYIQDLASLGFNRISLGVQDFDPEVQKAVHRIQDERTVNRLVEQARSDGIGSINFDLIYGLPKQTIQSFSRTLDRVIESSPDRISVYQYAHLPERFTAQKRINESDLPNTRTRLDLQKLTIEKLLGAGYVYIGMDHFAKPNDPLVKAMSDGSLRRSFQGYTTHMDCELIGMGVSAIGELEGCMYQNAKTLDEYYMDMEAGKLPVRKGVVLSREDKIRKQVIMDVMCHGRVDKRAFRTRYEDDFDLYFADEQPALDKLYSDGLVDYGPEHISVTEQGRYMLRNIAMVFDRYRNSLTSETRFSKTV